MSETTPEEKMVDVECPECGGGGGGDGGVQAACCGHPLPSGECCGIPIPEQVPCGFCGGSGHVEMPESQVQGAKSTTDDPRQNEWRPISSAPRDGTKILIYCAGRVESAEWIEADDDGPDYMGHDAGWRSDSGFSFPGRSFGNPEYFIAQESPPTHWMPLPKPPISD